MTTSAYRKIELAIEIVLILCVIVGTIIMFIGFEDKSGLSSSGIKNLKYFTVLSNEFCGIVALVDVIKKLRGKSDVSIKLKYIAVTSVGLTFSIIAFFLQPMYREYNMYKGGNFIFHLIAPVIAMVGFVLLGKKAESEKIPFRYSFVAVIPSIVYGLCYLANLLINGIGEWPDTNDWYGFVNWGYAVGACIFAGVVLFNWIVAIVLRGLYHVVLKKKQNQE